MLDLAGRNLGPYRLLDQLGIGGMATVYRAYHAAMDRYVAVKVLPTHLAGNPLFRARFDQEARTIARLQHRHILPVHDFGEADGLAYLVMHYTAGGTLGSLIRARRLTFRQAARLVIQVGQALGWAHAHGVIHRDVKPANVLIDRNGDALLTDFGIAKVIEGTLQITGEGTLIGTPAYMAPEQVLNEPIDGRTDLYALGIILYEALTGTLPFEAETPLALALMQVYNPLRPPRQLNRNIPEQLEQVIVTALAKQPDQRYPSAEHMVAALEAALETLADQPTPPGLVKPSSGLITQQLPEVTGPVPAQRPATVMIDRRRLREALAALAEGRWADVLPLLEGMPLDDPNVAALRQEALNQLVRQAAHPPTPLPEQPAAPITPLVPPELDRLRVDPADRAPYLGLSTFQEQDHAFFFGRDAVIAQLAELAGRAPLLCVLGPSGSGKSSVVLAGLLPALRRGALPNSDRWRYLAFRPGPRPLDALGVALATLRGGGLDDALVAIDRLTNSELALLDADLISPGEPGRRLVLVVDQFEELWTQAPTGRAALGEPQQRQLLSLLLAAADACTQASDPPLLLILSLRADFLHRAAEQPQLAAWISAHNLIVSPMSAGELREAITRPAQALGGAFEPGLVDELIGQVAGQPGALPLLEYTLLELWKTRRTDGVMTWAMFRALGGVEGALAARADAILETRYSPEQREQLRRLLVRLVQPGEGAADTRRRMALDDLVPAGGSAEEVRALLKPLTDERLITASRDLVTGVETVEVSHEALIRAWPALSVWVNEVREDLRLQLQIDEAAREWVAGAENPGLLWMGLRLDRAQEWIARAQPALNQRAQRFVEASQTQERERAARDDAARLERERLLIGRDADQRSARRLRLFLGITAGLLLLALLLAASAFASRQQALIAQAAAQRLAAEAQQARADEQAIARAGEALVELDRRPAQAIVLALSAVLTDTGAPYPPMVARAIYRAFDDVALRRTLTGHTGDIRAVAWRPDGRQVLTAGSDTIARIWDAASGAVVAQLGAPDAIRAAAWSPDGRHVATAGADMAVQIWDATSGAKLRELNGHSGIVTALAWSPDGRQLATASTDQTARIWDAATGSQLVELAGHTGDLRAVAWRPDGQQLLTGSADQTARIWDARTGAELKRLAGDTGTVLTVAWRPDGRQTLTAGVDGVARIWDAAGGALVRTLTGHSNFIYAAGWSPDGREIATASSDKSARVWDAQTGAELESLVGHTNGLYAARWSPDGRFMLTGGADATARIWEISASPGARVLRAQASWIPTAGRSPDGRWLVLGSPARRPLLIGAESGAPGQELASDDGAIRAAAWDSASRRLALGGSKGEIWDASSAKRLHTLSGTGQVYALAWSPDDRLVLAGDDQGAATVWDAASGALLRTIAADKGTVFAVGWSPDGQQILTAGMDGVVRFWDAGNGAKLRELKGHTSYIYALRASPDGRQILTGGADGVARVWDTASGAELRALAGHERAIYDVAWRPDGRLALTASADGTVRAWDIASGTDIRTLRSNSGAVLMAGWSADGTLALTGTTDGTVRQWLFDDTTILAALRQRACQLLSDEVLSKELAGWRGCAAELPAGANPYEAFLAGGAPTPTLAPTPTTCAGQACAPTIEQPTDCAAGGCLPTPDEPVFAPPTAILAATTTPRPLAPSAAPLSTLAPPLTTLPPPPPTPTQLASPTSTSLAEPATPSVGAGPPTPTNTRLSEPPTEPPRPTRAPPTATPLVEPPAPSATPPAKPPTDTPLVEPPTAPPTPTAVATDTPPLPTVPPTDTPLVEPPTPVPPPPTPTNTPLRGPPTAPPTPTAPPLPRRGR